jgi:hypothetical protein
MFYLLRHQLKLEDFFRKQTIKTVLFKTIIFCLMVILEPKIVESRFQLKVEKFQSIFFGFFVSRYVYLSFKLNQIEISFWGRTEMSKIVL